MTALNHSSERLDVLQDSINNACLSIGEDLIPEERRWLAGVLDAALGTHEKRVETPDPRETITDLFQLAMTEENRRLRARNLATVGKQSLIRSAGLGLRVGPTAQGVMRATDPTVEAVKRRYYMDAAAMAFRSAAAIDPQADAQGIILPKGSQSTDALVQDPDELFRLKKIALKKDFIQVYPWLLRVSGRVPQLSRVLQWTGDDLLNGTKVHIPFLVGADTAFDS